MTTTQSEDEPTMYFVSYTQTSDGGSKFGFGNMYISASANLEIPDVKEFRTIIEQETGFTNVVVMFFTPLKDKEIE